MNTHPAIVRTAAAIAAGAVAAGIGIVGAPPAGADPLSNYHPAKASDEQYYLANLSLVHGLKFPSAQARELAIELGYLTCILDKKGGAVPAGAEVYFKQAQYDNLCAAVSVDGGPSDNETREEFGRQAKQMLDQNFQQQQQSIDGSLLWGDQDKDGDGVANAIDSDPGDPYLH